MDQKVFRCYVEKKLGFDVAAKAAEKELSAILELDGLSLRIFNRYDIQNLPADKWNEVINTILSEPVSDLCYEESLPAFENGIKTLFVEPLPGQFDARRDACEQCVQMLLGGQRPAVRTAKVYAVGGVSDADFERVKNYLVNPLESRLACSEKPQTLADEEAGALADIESINGFIRMTSDELAALRSKMNMAMSMDDLAMLQNYFRDENRDPTETEVRVLDTYWSDHCRHTTFNTVINSADIQDNRVKNAYELFLSVCEKPASLMNIATAAMKHFRKNGKLPMLDDSAESNACTIQIKGKFGSETEDWLLFFKNETHNHPTEIEPFGGASTCIGGAIRDPLSGRAYTYHSMRITGAADPRKPYNETLPGKLPQRKLTLTAAEGFSSYGNQIGLTTGYVREFYNEGYVAKRMEAGAVIGAAPASWVRREIPADGDVVLLLGGRTGRDGIGGATGSSKTHGIETVTVCAAEVQKGNAPEERKILRLFRKPEVTKLIKRCNDFGAGGASVAIGELADGVSINLDTIPVKYNGLNGTELAISESQERMAIVIAASDLPLFLKYSGEENLECTVVAEVTAEKRLTMTWRGKKIVDIKREFLDTNGAKRFAAVSVPAAGNTNKTSQDSIKSKLFGLAGDINFCSQKGLVERFDSTIGAGSVFMPYGGKHALTEIQTMAALLPKKGAKTASVMAEGFDPELTENDPFGGSVYAVTVSAAKLIAAGTDLSTIHISLQEFFPSLNDDPVRWGKPFAAILGAFSAQMGLEIAAIGGKDSMSGSFGDIDVPSTMISFAAGVCDADKLISPEFKRAGNPVYILETPLNPDGQPDYGKLRGLWKNYTSLCNEGKILSAWVCEKGGACGGIMKMSFGNKIGFESDLPDIEINWGSIIFEASEELSGYELIGKTTAAPVLRFGGTSVDIEELLEAWQKPLESVFPLKTEQKGEAPVITDKRRAAPRTAGKIILPKAVIPMFPGTNCEYDTAAAVERAGGCAEPVLIRNLNPDMLRESAEALEKSIRNAQMLIIPGGFSGGDEPDGSGKFIVSMFKNPRLADAVNDLLYNRDGLILGICNGFQALIKLGLLPGGNIPQTERPTLTFNSIGRHQAKYVTTRVSSVKSPWLADCNPGELYVQPISHGEGRFAASEEILKSLADNGQIAFQYTDHNGVPSMDIAYNPNGSAWAVESILSPDGRIFGKMAHTERVGEFAAKNVPGNKNLPLFESGIKYFK